MNRPSIQQIAAVFLRYGNWTFGGGSSTVAVLQTELMDRRRWVDRETFTLAFGLARLTPGTNLLSFAAGVGWLLRGWGGALSALLAGSIPCSLVALLVTALYESWSKNPLVQIGLKGALAAAVGVMVATGWTLIRPFLEGDIASPKHPARWRSHGVVAASAISDMDSLDCSLHRCTLAGAQTFMKAFVLFLYLLKATLTTFSGLASLPVLRQDLVLNRHLITDHQLNTANAVTRTTPGLSAFMS